MKAYQKTTTMQFQIQEQRRTRMSPAVELEAILAVLAPAQREIAAQFTDYLRAIGIQFKTIRIYAYALRSLEVINKPYDEFTRNDLVSWIKYLELDLGLRSSTISVYKAYIKRFFKWLYNPDAESDEYPDLVRWMKTRPPKPDAERYIPSRAEVLRMISMAECQRDRAALFVLLESGARAGEFVKMRIMDVAFDKYGALVRVSGKTGARRIRLVESVPDLQLWLSMHPHRDDPAAPLWTIRKEPYNALSQEGLDFLIRKYCSIARTSAVFGAHCLRHAQATEDAKHYPEPVLRAKYGWTRNSDMPAVYVHHSARDTDGVILAHYGISPAGDEATSNLSLPKVCPRCKYSNSAMARFCMQCSAPLDARAVMEIEARSVEADEITAQVIAELVKRAPEVLAQILTETGLHSRIESVVKG